MVCHDGSDFLIDCYLLDSVLEFGPADVDLHQFIKLDNAAVLIIKSLYCEDQSVFMIAKHIPQEIGSI